MAKLEVTHDDYSSTKKNERFTFFLITLNHLSVILFIWVVRIVPFLLNFKYDISFDSALLLYFLD